MATASASLVEALGGHTTEVFGPVGSSDVLLADVPDSSQPDLSRIGR